FGCATPLCPADAVLLGLAPRRHGSRLPDPELDDATQAAPGRLAPGPQRQGIGLKRCVGEEARRPGERLLHAADLGDGWPKSKLLRHARADPWGLPNGHDSCP